jgi:ABC-type phosphonate transport system ATPase subunit
MELFRNTIKDIGAALVMVSHDLALVRKAGLREVQVKVNSDSAGFVNADIDDRKMR